MRRLFILIFILFFISNIYAECDKNQIDINNADLSELDELYGIGPAKAQAIIDFREDAEFGLIDDLINVKGIGDVTLENIKNQGLACVEDEENSEEYEKPIEEIKQEIPVETEDTSFEEIKLENNYEEETIILTKDIKTEESGKLNKNHFATYGLIGFCLLLGFLYLMKQKVQIKKNEFR